jgi:hypothetical protein
MRVVGATTDVRVGVSLRVGYGYEVYTAGVISFASAVGTSTGVISFASNVGTGISAWVVVARAVDVC